MLPDFRDTTIGFRCAKTVWEGQKAGAEKSS